MQLDIPLFPIALVIYHATSAHVAKVKFASLTPIYIDFKAEKIMEQLH